MSWLRMASAIHGHAFGRSIVRALLRHRFEAVGFFEARGLA